jgi:uncharacterized protein (DUF488 family)
LDFKLIYTIGHSTHELENFLELLRERSISAIADVRSAPYSRFQPQFNKETLSASLSRAGIEYVFLGDLLGGRSLDPQDFENNRVVYSRLKSKPSFLTGVERVVSGSTNFKLALMCTEKEPLECHRTLLISHALHQMGQEMMHIHGDGNLESHSDAMKRLLKLFKLDEPDLFRSELELLEEALLRQEKKVAYVDDRSTPSDDEIEALRNSKFGES